MFSSSFTYSKRNYYSIAASVGPFPYAYGERIFSSQYFYSLKNLSNFTARTSERLNTVAEAHATWDKNLVQICNGGMCA